MNNARESTLANNRITTARTSGIAILGRMTGRGLGYLSQILLARFLAPEGFGLFAIGWTLLRLFSIAGHLGLDYGITKFGAQYQDNDRSKLRSLIILSVSSAFLSGLAFGIMINLTASWLAVVVFKKPELEQILKGFSIVFPLATTLRVLASIIVFKGKTLYAAISEDITQPLSQMFLFALWLKPYGGVDAAILSTIISYSIAVITGLTFTAYLSPNIFKLEKVDTHDLAPLFRYSLPAIAGATLGAFNLWGDRLLVGYFGTKSDAGIYQSISLITMLTTTALSGIKISFAPALSRLHHEKKNLDLEILIKSIARWSLYITIPILLFVFANSKEVINTFFGKDYLSGSSSLQILTIGQIFYITFAIVDQTLLMTGKQKEWLIISVIAFILTVALDAYFIQKFNILGASIVSSGMLFLIGIASIIYIKKHLGFWMIGRTHARVFVSSLLTGIAAQAIISKLTISGILKIMSGFSITITIFIIFLFAIGMDKSDKKLLANLLKMNHH
ncbi:MAG: flippase [Chitinophagales bacterium]|nr:flippase [Chitinophagales bacterium]